MRNFVLTKAQAAKFRWQVPEKKSEVDKKVQKSVKHQNDSEFFITPKIKTTNKSTPKRAILKKLRNFQLRIFPNPLYF